MFRFMWTIAVICVLSVTGDRLDKTYLPPSSPVGSLGDGDTLQPVHYGRNSSGRDAPEGSTGVGPTNPDAQAKTIKFEHANNPDGSYNFMYETENGIQQSESGQLKNLGDEEVMVVEGSYSYVGPDGVTYSVTYVADEKGFRPIGDHLPVLPQEMQDAAEQNGSDEEASYHEGHNRDTEAVVIEAQPQADPQQQATTISPGYHY